MAKKIEDIISNTKKREPSKYFSELARATKKQLGTQQQERFEEEPALIYRQPKQKSGKSLMVVLVLVFIALVLGVSVLISGATITIIPKSATVPINAQFSAVKNGVGDVLPFELVAISDESKEILQGTPQASVPTKAKGSVILYNVFSAASQPLSQGTRLQATSGKIYLLDKGAVIPKYTKTGTDITPGQTTVTVTAEKAGSDYNDAMTDFSIPGFKGTPKAKGFYGRSKTAMTGGGDGAAFGLAPDLVAQEQQKLSADLKTKIIDRIAKEIPEGYILFPNSTTIVQDDSGAQGVGDTASITVSAKGTGYAYIFDAQKLTAAIAKVALPYSAPTDIVSIKNMGELTFAIPPIASIDPSNPQLQTSASDATNLSFTLSGTAKIVWAIDGDAIKKQSAGVSKHIVLDSLTQNTGIIQADVVVRPFWQGKLPNNLDHIDVVVKDPFQ